MSRFPATPGGPVVPPGTPPGGPGGTPVPPGQALDGVGVMRCGTGAWLLSPEGRFRVHEYDNPDECCEDTPVQRRQYTVGGVFMPTVSAGTWSTGCGVVCTMTDCNFSFYPSLYAWHAPFDDGGPSGRPPEGALGARFVERTDFVVNQGSTFGGGGVTQTTIAGTRNLLITPWAPLRVGPFGAGGTRAGFCNRDDGPGTQAVNRFEDFRDQASENAYTVGQVRAIGVTNAALDATDAALFAQMETVYVEVAGGVVTGTNGVNGVSWALQNIGDIILPWGVGYAGRTQNLNFGPPMRPGGASVTYALPGHRCTQGQQNGQAQWVQRTNWPATGTANISGWVSGAAGNYNIPGVQFVPDGSPMNGSYTENHRVLQGGISAMQNGQIGGAEGVGFYFAG